MGEQGQVPAPRRAGLPRRRRTTALPSADAAVTPYPAGDSAADASGTPDESPRVAELAALLSEIGALRTSLATDLSLAAAALEAGEHELAADVVDGDLSALHEFEDRALGHLGRLHGVLPVPSRRPVRRLLPAAPVLAAAAALIGVVVLPGPSATAPAPAMTSAAAASFELHRLARSGASPDELRQVAEELNDQLAALVAAAPGDPAAAQQALLLLRDTTRVLAGAQDTGELDGVLAEAQALAAKLAAVLPRTVQSVRPTRLVLVPPVVAQPAPRRSASTSSTGTTSTAKPSASATPRASAAPSPTPPPTPTATPTPEPTGTPQREDGPLLPGAGGLPYGS